METDGVRTGFDLEIIAKISDTVDVPVIASGGVGTLEHFYDGFVIGKEMPVLRQACSITVR